MKIAVLGTGSVGETIADKLISLGHEVWMGSRSASNDKAVAWAAKAGGTARAATYADAAAFAELVFNCTKGTASLDALRSVAPGSLDGKVIVDVSNPLDFSTSPPSLAVANTDSLGEQLQRAFPAAHVVKTLNTMWAGLMVNPRMLPGGHTNFLAGNHPPAKAAVAELLRSFGWRDDELLDLGDIAGARGTEAYLLLWLRLWKATGTGALNVAVVQAAPAD